MSGPGKVLRVASNYTTSSTACAGPRQFLYVSHLRASSTGGMLLALVTAPSLPDTQHSSFTAWTTRVSNPICSPRFRASASVTAQQAAFATGVPPYIYTFYRYTWNSTCLYCTLADQFLWLNKVEPCSFTTNLICRLRTLYAQ